MVLHTDIPTHAQVDRLLGARNPCSVSIYAATDPASRVLAVRRDDIPGSQPVAAILRYPLP